MLDPGHLDSPRQRIEMYTPGAPSGTSWEYTWKEYISSQTKTTEKQNALMQILTRDPKDGHGLPIMSLQAINGIARVENNYQKCDKKLGCKNVKMEELYDKTVVHTVK